MPGPAILYMSAQTLAYGHKAGLMAALGIHLGCYVHIAAASVGLAALLDHAPALYSSSVWRERSTCCGWAEG
jgi:threonine/homoserine/homoserine lactone efflux protein